jgi:N-acetylglucosamine kinase-like BadF-type ATPase
MPAGRTARTGGWGYIFGDEGGGFDIARQALRAALRAEEGWGPPPRSCAALLDATGSADANGALHRFYTPDWPRSRVAALAPLVDEAAMAGDAVARDILHNAAQQLAVLTSAVRRQLWPPGEPARVAWTGGVFRSRMLLDRYRCLVELEDGNRAGPPRVRPRGGRLDRSLSRGGSAAAEAFARHALSGCGPPS